MISVILACSDDVKQQALREGFREQTVLIKHTVSDKLTAEREMMRMGVFQCFATEFLGMGPD